MRHVDIVAALSVADQQHLPLTQGAHKIGAMLRPFVLSAELINFNQSASV